MTLFSGYRGAVQRGPELERILALPRRKISPEYGQACVAKWTPLLRQPGSSGELRPVQAISFEEMFRVRGLAGVFQRVGAGKFLTSVLAPVVLRAERPILIVPAAVEKATQRRMAAERATWLIPRNINVVAAETLGAKNGERKIREYHPDLWIWDESHMARYLTAGRTKKCAWWFRDHPTTMGVFLTGSGVKDGIQDLVHIFDWALKNGSPLPRLETNEAEQWEQALDESRPVPAKPALGALKVFGVPAEAGIGDRMHDTFGVVGTGDDQILTSLYITGHLAPVGQKTEANFKTLRDLWMTPDGVPLMYALELSEVAEQISQGFHHYQDPPPSQGYRDARRLYFQEVRDLLEKSFHAPLGERLATPGDVEREILEAPETGRGAHPLRALYNAWITERDAYVGVTRCRWHDDVFLDWCVKWAHKGTGIIWARHRFFAEALAWKAGILWYNDAGHAEDGSFVEDAPPGRSIVMSLAAAVGLNLQGRPATPGKSAWKGFSRNLIIDPPGVSWLLWEQLIGRTHRDGQLEDAVTVEYAIRSIEGAAAWDKALDSCPRANSMAKQIPKIQYADVTMPSVPFLGPRWVKSAKPAA